MGCLKSSTDFCCDERRVRGFSLDLIYSRVLLGMAVSTDGRAALRRMKLSRARLRDDGLTVTVVAVADGIVCRFDHAGMAADRDQSTSSIR
jgi:hypothetical protein